MTVEAGDLTGVTITARPPVAVAGDVGRERLEQCRRSTACKILLVDDGETNRKLISLFLTRSGATVETGRERRARLARRRAGTVRP